VSGCLFRRRPRCCCSGEASVSTLVAADMPCERGAARIPMRAAKSGVYRSIDRTWVPSARTRRQSALLWWDHKLEAASCTIVHGAR
jgi:hypothetical protein